MPLLLAFLPAQPSLSESIAFQLNGLIVVFIALGSIWGLLECMGWIFRRAAAAKITAAASTAASTPVATPAPATAEDAGRLIAIISAAIHVTLAGRSHRIVSVTHSAEHQDWSREGRRQIFSSHKVR
jgi:Na+-transporting methylmalonyl-CoA/oxaloacetate decarboxylase gamma subunit